jgi:hypothetical protein
LQLQIDEPVSKPMTEQINLTYRKNKFGQFFGGRFLTSETFWLNRHKRLLITIIPDLQKHF